MIKMLTMVGVVEVFDEFDALFKTSEKSKFTTKRIFTKKEIKNSNVISLIALPVCICHGYLIHIYKRESINIVTLLSLQLYYNYKLNMYEQ